MEPKMRKIVLMASGLATLALLSACHDMQRWQYEEYQPNMVGDIWAPRPDWKVAEDRARVDWEAALKEMGANSGTR